MRIRIRSILLPPAHTLFPNLWFYFFNNWEGGPTLGKYLTVLDTLVLVWKALCGIHDRREDYYDYYCYFVCVISLGEKEKTFGPKAAPNPG